MNENSTESLDIELQKAAAWACCSEPELRIRAEHRANELERCLRAICDHAVAPTTGDSSDPARVEYIHILRARELLEYCQAKPETTK